MSRWVHSDTHCPGRPLLGRAPGRSYRCRCGRLWRWDVDRGLLSTWNRWTLLSSPTEPQAHKASGPERSQQ